MASYTKNYNLKKPGSADNALIEDLNENADIIDEELKKRVPFDASTNRVPLGKEPIMYKELVRFTASGTFNPASYPTKDGRYDVIIQGAGGSGAWGPEDSNPHGGEAGGIVVQSGLPLPAGVSYNVIVGKGGEGVRADVGYTTATGKAGGRSSFAGFSAPGGMGGYYGQIIISPPSPTTENGYTQNMGSTGASGKGGDSLLAAGGKNNLNGNGGAGSLGSGGGAADKKNTDYTYYSGKGGDGVVIIYGWVGGR